MAKAGQVYDVIEHDQVTSIGLADVQTITVPNRASAFEITAATNSAYLSVDGTDPSSTHGQVIVAGATPVLCPYVTKARGVLKVASAAAANSVVRVTWLA